VILDSRLNRLLALGTLDTVLALVQRANKVFIDPAVATVSRKRQAVATVLTEKTPL
jgi:hypothetical protein